MLNGLYIQLTWSLGLPKYDVPITITIHSHRDNVKTLTICTLIYTTHTALFQQIHENHSHCYAGILGLP